MTIAEQQIVEQFDWHRGAEDYAHMFGLAREDVEQIAANPATSTLDPSNAVREWRTERRTRGDVTVIVTYPPNQRPMIWGIYLCLPGNDASGQHRSAGNGSGSMVPKTLHALRKRIIGAGLKIVAGGSHDRVETKDGVYVTSLPRTPSDHRSVPNAWTALRRKGYDV